MDGVSLNLNEYNFKENWVANCWKLLYLGIIFHVNYFSLELLKLICILCENVEITYLDVQNIALVSEMLKEKLKKLVSY